MSSSGRLPNFLALKPLKFGILTNNLYLSACGQLILIDVLALKSCLGASMETSTMAAQVPPRARTHQPCAACRMLRRRCDRDCILAPYFPSYEAEKFAGVHKVFGASNVIRMIQVIVLLLLISFWVTLSVHVIEFGGFDKSCVGIRWWRNRGGRMLSKP